MSTSSESSESETETEKKSQLLKNGQQLEKKAKVTHDKEHAKSQNKEKKQEKVKAKDKKEDGAGSDSGKDNKKVIKTTTVKDMLRAKRDSMRNMVDGTGAGSSNGMRSENTEDSRDADSSDDSEDSSVVDRCEVEAKPDASTDAGGVDIKLPDNLPIELRLNIARITEASKTSGKSNFFDSSNMDLLFL